MRHQNTVLHGLLKAIPWGVFDALVERYQADARVRRLTTKSQFIALLQGQLAGAQSLREIEATSASHRAKLYHLGARAPARTTLADANARRPAAVYVALFAHLAAQAHRGLRRHLGEAVNLIDATSLPLGAMAKQWAEYKAHGSIAKLHLVFEAGTRLPRRIALTPARVNDITPAKDFAINRGETYVFDLGYYDFGWWRRLHDAECRFVTRLKKNARPTLVAERPVASDGPVTADRDIRLTSRWAKAIADVPLREVVVAIDGAEPLHLVTNDLEASAEAIADLYKARWRIELFFRWIKQNLRIRHFLGTSENAVRTQVAIALIAYLLLRLAHAAQTAVPDLLRFSRLVRANLMHRRDIHDLDKPPRPIPGNPAQQELVLC